MTTGSANPIGGTQAQLNGTVNPNGASTTAKHQLQVSGAWVSGASAGVGRGVSLDGVDDYVSFPAAAWVDYDLSIEGWVYLREYRCCRFIDFGNGPNANNVVAVLHDANRGGPVFYTFWASEFSSIASPIPVPLNRWTHLAFVYNHFYGAEGSSGRIYLNGTLVAEGPLARPLRAVAATTTWARAIGAENPRPTRFSTTCGFGARCWTSPRLTRGKARS